MVSKGEKILWLIWVALQGDIPFYPRVRFVVVIAIVILAGNVAKSDSAPVMEKVWEANTKLLFNDALLLLRGLPSSREVNFARAVTLLNVQPKTQANIDEATRLFEGLIPEKAQDDYGIRARYYLGRIAQVHNTEKTDLAKARQLFRDLYAEHPDHPMAQLGLIKSAIIDLYHAEPSVPMDERIARLERENIRLQDPYMQKDYHLLMARTYLLLKDTAAKAQALSHYLAADKAGILRWRPRSDIYAAIGELARELGQKEVAIAYYGKFLADYERDNRAYAVRKALEDLKNQGPLTAHPKLP